ncbi:L-proline dehydrogenase [Streptomyces sp. WMMB 714]|uniref:proline dehydrogenase family protein n=1 Tax=Streptomyces sp. WMMB 714 TaxID=1286822 RepID=UPI0005F8306B|nr:proline dehydrogenase family protein [Streptomyces sp. WMMB 714]SCK35970.1 L-proline dehydrogenase [Streptomyces sp. WMMB 714]
MFGPVLLAASRSDGIRRLVSSAPVTRPVVDRFVAGEQLAPCLDAVRALTGRGLQVTLDHLGEDTTDRTEALRNRDAYLALAQALADEGLGPRAEMSVKLSAFGQALPGGHDIALANVRPVVEAAAEAGTTVTLDMEAHHTVDSTLAVLADLRAGHPQTGAVLQSCLHRTEEDALALSGEGSRVRLVKGAYDEPADVAHQKKADVDRAYVRCLKILMSGKGYPMVGSHDPRMVAIAQELARRLGRKHDEFEFQMLYGIRDAEQQRLADEGHRVRVYVPYGTDWYAYFMRRLAERPANLGFFLRSLATRS